MRVSKVKLWDGPPLCSSRGRPGRRLKKAGMVKVWRNGFLLGACLVFAVIVCSPVLSYSQPPPPPYYYNNNYYGYGQPYYQPNTYPYGYYYHPYGYAPAIGPILRGFGRVLHNDVRPYEYNEEWQEHHQWPANRNWHGDE